MFIKTFQKCSFLSIFRYNDDFTLRGVNKGQMKVETKIELLAGLECIATKNLTTFETNHLNHFQKQLSRNVGSALDGIEMDLLDLIIRSYFIRSQQTFKLNIFDLIFRSF